jgi:hypothetical protein
MFGVFMLRGVRVAVALQVVRGLVHPAENLTSPRRR